MAWEHFPHGADVGVRGIGATREEAFAQAALALTAVLTDPARVVSKDTIDIRCEAPDDELLFVDWLNALIYEMATRSAVFGRFEVKLRDWLHLSPLVGEFAFERGNIAFAIPAC